MSELERLSEHLWMFRDSCNVYAITAENEALLIDAGSGAVAESLENLGYKVTWILHTHHHRDQCWGDYNLSTKGAKVAVPAFEQHLFEQAEMFWQNKRTYDNYNNRNTFFTVAQNIPVSNLLNDYEEFNWRGYRFFVLPAKGHTMGSITLMVTVDGKRMAFSGDLMTSGGKLYQLHAMEYGYGDMKGVPFTLESMRALHKAAPEIIYPSHGEIIKNPKADIESLEGRLLSLMELGPQLKAGDRNYLADGRMIKLSKHVLWSGPQTYSNFYVIISNEGKAMFIDYGLSLWEHAHDGRDREDGERIRFIEHHLDELRCVHGVNEIDVVIPTHIHDDHICGIPFLQRFHGTSCWALEQLGSVLEDPFQWSALPSIYPQSIKIDRKLIDGESFNWEGFSFEIYYAPGQTPFHSVILAHIDGLKIAFTGDNLYPNENQKNSGWEAPFVQPTVFRNGYCIQMHRRCAELMDVIKPDLICPGHYEVRKVNGTDMARYADWIFRKEEAFRQLVHEPVDFYMDLFWARFLPYQIKLDPGKKGVISIKIHNVIKREATFGVRLIPSSHFSTDEQLYPIALPPDGVGSIDLTIWVKENVKVRFLITAEITIDGCSLGPVAEALVMV